MPEHVSDFIMHVRELTPDQRGGHCSIHFRSAAELRKWTKVLEDQKLIEAGRVIARAMFYPQPKSQRIKDAAGRTAIHREWTDASARVEFEKFLYASLQWDDEEGIMSQFKAAGVKLGASGMVLGISCIVNPADASQTNILAPFVIDEPPIPPEERQPRQPTSLVRLLSMEYVTFTNVA